MLSEGGKYKYMCKTICKITSVALMTVHKSEGKWGVVRLLSHWDTVGGGGSIRHHFISTFACSLPSLK
jgi:hypothetical protein